MPTAAAACPWPNNRNGKNILIARRDYELRPIEIKKKSTGPKDRRELAPSNLCLLYYFMHLDIFYPRAIQNPCLSVTSHYIKSNKGPSQTTVSAKPQGSAD